jgi:hypothetical protein
MLHNRQTDICITTAANPATLQRTVLSCKPTFHMHQLPMLLLFRQAMEAHGAAQELRDAAEDEAQRFFEAMGAAPGTGATCRENWAEDQHVTSYAVFEDLEEAIQQVCA